MSSRAWIHCANADYLLFLSIFESPIEGVGCLCLYPRDGMSCVWPSWPMIIKDPSMVTQDTEARCLDVESTQVEAG